MLRKDNSVRQLQSRLHNLYGRRSLRCAALAEKSAGLCARTLAPSLALVGSGSYRLLPPSPRSPLSAVLVTAKEVLRNSASAVLEFRHFSVFLRVKLPKKPVGGSSEYEKAFPPRRLFYLHPGKVRLA